MKAEKSRAAGLRSEATAELTTVLKPFRVSASYIDWAHESAAGDDQTLAAELCDWPSRGSGVHCYKLFVDPAHVGEIADVAALYVGGRDTDLRAAAVRARAIAWLAARGPRFARCWQVSSAQGSASQANDKRVSLLAPRLWLRLDLPRSPERSCCHQGSTMQGPSLKKVRVSPRPFGASLDPGMAPGDAVRPTCGRASSSRA